MKRLARNMTTLITVCFIFGLVGCGSSVGKVAMTNDAIIKEVQKCKDNDLEPVSAHIWGGPRIFAITCTPKKERAN